MGWDLTAGGGGAIEGLSAADQVDYPIGVDFTRALRIAVSDYEYYLSQLGRLLYRDDFNETAIQWVAAAGAVVFDTATCLKGTQSMKLTTGITAGAQAIARKFTLLPADQAFRPSPLVVLEAYFKPLDTNIRDIQMFVRLDDSVLKYEAALRFWYQQSASVQNAVQYLDHAGNFQTVDTYAIATPAGSVGDPWHHVVIALNYLQGANGYLRYAAIQFDDFSYIPAAPGIAAHTVTSGGTRLANVDLLVTTDTTAATICNLDEVRFADLSGLSNLQVPAE